MLLTATVLPLYALCTPLISLWGNRKQKLWSLSLLCAFLLPVSTLQYRGYPYDSTEKEETRRLSRPFMVGLFNRRRLLCSGTLIKDNWVLTAAHCFPNENTYVILGAISRTKREPGKRVANITKTFSYPGFNLLTYEHDIMLLQIQIKGRYHHDGKIVPLSRTTEDIMPGTLCRVIGWGTIHQKMGSDTLHEVNTTVLDRRICNDQRHYHLEPVVTAHMLCAGDKIERMDKCLVRFPF
uniref:Peptidase S1 domain-containing protein n=1 Tax=Anolis carolinensis TaxID=28377 RepID=G1KR41_ANOCA